MQQRLSKFLMWLRFGIPTASYPYSLENNLTIDDCMIISYGCHVRMNHVDWFIKDSEDGLLIQETHKIEQSTPWIMFRLQSISA
jgi:hypothetical protein